MDIEGTIPHATLAEVVAGRGHEMVTVEDDVLDVVRRLKRIHAGLNVRWNPRGYFVIYELCPDGRERLVTTVKELDSRLVEHFEMLASEAWNAKVAAEAAEKEEDEQRKDMQHDFEERVGEIGERLHHALRRDFEFKDSVWVPEKHRLKI